MPVSDRQYPADGRDALILSAVAAAIFHPLSAYGPGWWRGARLHDMDPPFDLEWLHNAFAWTAQYLGPVLFWLFAAAFVLLVIVGAFTAGFRTDSPALRRALGVARTAPALALLAVAALGVGWFLLTQVAALIAPFLGMYHGEIHPAVP
ncbi:hypothetical protein OHA72_49205 [Dactylosporangium sp. NBC_01737]|uniref:hypothetical protein n=1 Tax=Dactylosporangium sp. NBC_01737 TaxID=2975959 RepID=UPI002E1437C3|nr:hypothetical protein OHA72_49205 [Dactylosporangium sp. NBC_01737]